MNPAQEPQPGKLPPIGNPSIGQSPQNVVQSGSPAQSEPMVERRPGQPAWELNFPREMPVEMENRFPESERSRMRKIFSGIGSTASWLKDNAPLWTYYMGKGLVLEMPKRVVKGVAQAITHPVETAKNVKDAFGQALQEKKYMLGGGIVGATSTGLIFTFLSSEAPILAAGLYIKAGATYATTEVARARARKGLTEAARVARTEAEQRAVVEKFQKAERRIRSFSVGSAVGSVSTALGFTAGGVMLQEGTSVSGVYSDVKGSISSAWDTTKDTGESVWSGIKQVPDVARDLPRDVADTAKDISRETNDYLFGTPDQKVPVGSGVATGTIPGEPGALEQASEYVKDKITPDVNLPSENTLNKAVPDNIPGEDTAKEAYHDAFGHPPTEKVEYDAAGGTTTITKVPGTSGYIDRALGHLDEHASDFIKHPLDTTKAALEEVRDDALGHPNKTVIGTDPVTGTHEYTVPDTGTSGWVDRAAGGADEAVINATESVKNAIEDVGDTVSSNPVATTGVALGTAVTGYQVGRMNNPKRPSLLGRLFRTGK